MEVVRKKEAVDDVWSQASRQDIPILGFFMTSLLICNILCIFASELRR